MKDGKKVCKPTKATKISPEFLSGAETCYYRYHQQGVGMGGVDLARKRKYPSPGKLSEDDNDKNDDDGDRVLGIRLFNRFNFSL